MVCLLLCVHCRYPRQKNHWQTGYGKTNEWVRRSHRQAWSEDGWYDSKGHGVWSRISACITAQAVINMSCSKALMLHFESIAVPVLGETGMRRPASASASTTTSPLCLGTVSVLLQAECCR